MNKIIEAFLALCLSVVILGMPAAMMLSLPAKAATADVITTPEGITLRKVTMPDGQKCVVASSELGSLNGVIDIECDWRGRGL